MRAASVPLRLPTGLPLRSKRLLALADDERLVEQIRRGNELAFEVAFERYGASILGFCRHMLGTTEEAEDAVQHTFAAAYRDLTRADGRSIALKPWLYTIARNRSLSMLRARREQPVEAPELPTAGLADEVQQRVELRELLEDLRGLPEDQRAALLLAELGDLSHPEVAGVLGCEVPRVKALVFRARSGLIARRDARDTPCDEIRAQLANLSGGSLRRSGLRHHLSACPGCREYREEVKRQRQLLALALPMVPGLALKKSVLAAVGFGGGAAGGGGAAVGVGGLGAAFGSLGSATAAKVAVVGALAAGGAVTGAAVVDDVGGGGERGPAERVQEPARDPAQGGVAGVAASSSSNSPARERAQAGVVSERTATPGEERGAGARGTERREIRPGESRSAAGQEVTPGEQVGGTLGRGQLDEQKLVDPAPQGNARGPVEPQPGAPVRRGALKPQAPVQKVEKVAPVKTAPAPVVEPIEEEPEVLPEVPAEQVVAPKK